MSKGRTAVRFRDGVIGILVLVGFCVQAQSEQPDKQIDSNERNQVIDYVLKRLDAEYVFPDVARKVEDLIRERQRSGAYNGITSARTLGITLTEELRAAAKDQHLGVRYWPAPATPQPPASTPNSQAQKDSSADKIHELQWINYGLWGAERLPGNVGYIDVKSFYEIDNLETQTVAAAMTFISNTDALIIDVRENEGGKPEMVALLISYLLGANPVHLTDVYCRVPVEGVCEEGNHTTEYWTSREVSGKRYLERPVYVLTSRHSFSAAEEFAYDLQVLKRATIVGEATGGGANPGTMYRFMNDYQFFVPQARAINATTKTNWDGAGVKPDIPAPADRALQVAHLNTLKSLLPRAATGDRKAEISEAIDKLERETKNK
jgi:hypothetical protein